MKSHSVRPTDDEIEKAVQTYSNMLFRLCFTVLGNYADAEDAVSETMLKYITKSAEFNSEEHRKAWLLKVASNVCSNMRRKLKRNSCVNIDELYDLCGEEKDFDVLSDVMNLPPKYKTVIYLHYIEGYKIRELAEMLTISEAAVKKRLQYGREMLRMEYENIDL